MKQVKELIQPFLKKIPDIRPGDTVEVHQKFKEKDKEKTQVFKGIVIARKHGSEAGATITVRRVVDGVGVERIFPLHLPSIEKIKLVKRSKVRRAKLYFLRTAKGKRAKLKRKEFEEAVAEEPKMEKIEEEKESTEQAPEEVPEVKAEKSEEASQKVSGEKKETVEQKQPAEKAETETPEQKAETKSEVVQ